MLFNDSLLLVSKSFLEPLGINDNHKAIKILSEEFIYGYNQGLNDSMARTVEDIRILDDLLMNLKNIYNRNENKSFVMMAMKKCSDMFVYVCKFSIDNYFSQKK